MAFFGVAAAAASGGQAGVLLLRGAEAAGVVELSHGHCCCVERECVFFAPRARVLDVLTSLTTT